MHKWHEPHYKASAWCLIGSELYARFASYPKAGARTPCDVCCPNDLYNQVNNLTGYKKERCFCHGGNVNLRRRKVCRHISV